MNRPQLIHKCLSSNNCPNLLLCGVGDIASVFQSVLFEKYNIRHTNHIVLNEIDIYSSHIHYEINMHQIKNKNSNDFFNFLYDCISSENLYIQSAYRIFVFKEFLNVKKVIQNRLRVIIEKYRQTTLFVFLTSRPNSIIQPIHSRCFCIRIPDLSRKEKIKLLHGIPSNNKTRIYDLLYDSHMRKDIESLLVCYKGIDHGYQTPCEIITHKLNQILQKQQLNEKNIMQLKDISYQILKNNIIIPDIYGSLLSSFITNPRYTMEMKYKLVQLFAESDYNLLKSYKKLIHLESLFLNINLIVRIEENSH